MDGTNGQNSVFRGGSDGEYEKLRARASPTSTTRPRRRHVNPHDLQYGRRIRQPLKLGRPRALDCVKSRVFIGAHIAMMFTASASRPELAIAPSLFIPRRADCPRHALTAGVAMLIAIRSAGNDSIWSKSIRTTDVVKALDPPVAEARKIH